MVSHVIEGLDVWRRSSVIRTGEWYIKGADFLTFCCNIKQAVSFMVYEYPLLYILGSTERWKNDSFNFGLQLTYLLECVEWGVVNPMKDVLYERDERRDRSSVLI